MTNEMVYTSQYIYSQKSYSRKLSLFMRRQQTNRILPANFFNTQIFLIHERFLLPSRTGGRWETIRCRKVPQGVLLQAEQAVAIVIIREGYLE